ncbi:MAG: tRNA pseudouridine(55) synthase TruB [Deltaproteobacteria bacterium]|nr:tRNA pseudouridine(55) synthase TruB [Deltaproteobacteria bacterium]
MAPIKSYFVFLDKPAEMTSQQCLHRFKKKHWISKAGHHGTLDPFATGLLLVGVNEAVKFFQFVDDCRKTYEAEIYLGVRTDTLDCTGAVLESRAVEPYSLSQITLKAELMTGRMLQTPPMYSAKKINGKKLYELARKGIEIERPARPVEIFDFTILGWEHPVVRVSTTCSRGTYIRVLAEQFAGLLGTCAHLKSLRRTVLCGHNVLAAHLPDADHIDEKHMIPIDELINHCEKVSLNDAQVKDLFYGKKIAIKDFMLGTDGSDRADAPCSGGTIVATYGDQFVGVLKKKDGYLESLRLINADLL